MDGVQHGPVDAFAPNPDKPGRRWELSPELGIESYNLNVADLRPGEGLSENGYHYHEDQRECFYVAHGRCQVEVEEGVFRLDAGDVAHFDEGVAHLLHDPFDEPCRLVAIGSPTEGRRPVHCVATAEELLTGRYGSATPDPVPADDE